MSTKSNDTVHEQLIPLNRIFNLLTFIVAVEEDAISSTHKILACRFLLSLYTLDTLGWLVAKLMYYEVLRLAESLYGTRGIILTSLVVTTTEVIFEFAASSQTPRVFSVFSSEKVLCARPLALFALDAYSTSAAVGVVVYGIIGVSVMFGGLGKEAALVTLIAAYNFQYSILNQCGDQALELSKPHWLKTFDGCKLRFPSYLCTGLTTKRQVTADSLSIYLSLSRLVLAALFSAVFVLLRNNEVFRFSFAIFVSLLSALVCLKIRSTFRGPHGTSVCESIVNEEVEDENTSSYPYLWNMPPLDISLVAFYVCSFSLPDQAFNAIVSLVILKLSTEVGLVVAVVGVIAVIVYFLIQLRKENISMSSRSGEPPAASEFSRWLQLLITNALSLTVVALLFVFTSSNIVLYIVLPVLIIYTLAKQALVARFVTFIFKFPENRSSAVGYYANVLYVLVSGPLLVLNWVLVETVDSGRWQVAAVVLVAGGAYVLSTTVFTFNRNLRHGVNTYSSGGGLSSSDPENNVRSPHRGTVDKGSSSTDKHDDL